MQETKTEGYEVVYYPLPKELFYDTEDKAKDRDRRFDVVFELVEKVRHDLESRAAKLLLPPIMMRWIGADGKTLWTEKAHAANAEAFRRVIRPGHPKHGARITGLKAYLARRASQDAEIDNFIEGMRAAIQDVKVPLFVIFEGSDGQQAKFCLRFT